MRKYIVIPLLAALAMVLTLLGAAPAQAHGQSPRTPQAKDPNANLVPVLLGADLSGDQEVPTPGGPAVGDRDGRGKARILVLGDKVTFSLEWSGIEAPTLGHIHEGKKGVNGPVRVGLFGEKLPDNVTAAAGMVTVTDPKLVAALRNKAEGFYVNLHTAKFPGGAIRGQLKRLDLSAGVVDVVRPGALFAFLNGSQEVPVPGGPAVGDPDGLAISFVDAKKDHVRFSMAWTGIDAPTLGHIHKAPTGVNGPVVVPLFTSPVPSTIFAIAGSVHGVDKNVTKEIRKNPAGFYVNIHNATFPGGALRGQLHAAG